MEITVGTTREGLPLVSWVQLYPYNRALLKYLMIVWGPILMGTLLFGSVLSGKPDTTWIGMLFGGFMVTMLGMGYAMKQNPGLAQRQERDIERARRELLLKKQKCRAFVRSSGDGLELVVEHAGAGPAKYHLDDMPLEGLKAFQLGSSNDFFSYRSNLEQRADSLAIIAEGPAGIVVVAQHGGAKIEMANLHRTLTEVFILRRRDWLAAWRRAKAPAAERIVPASTPPAEL